MDFSKWDLIHEFTIDEVIRLWCEKEQSAPLQDDCIVVSKLLRSGISDGKLRCIINDNLHKINHISNPLIPNNYDQCKFHRSELKKFARSINQYPLFLFSNKRKQPIVQEKKLRPSQKHKERARAVATTLWDKDPDITIADMIIKDEIHKLFDGKSYSDSTLRNWIKDLCPNREPGRRPNAANPQPKRF